MQDNLQSRCQASRIFNAATPPVYGSAPWKPVALPPRPPKATMVERFGSETMPRSLPSLPRNPRAMSDSPKRPPRPTPPGGWSLPLAYWQDEVAQARERVRVIRSTPGGAPSTDSATALEELA